MSEQHCFGHTNNHDDPGWVHTPECKERRKRGYWMYTTVYECPLCGYEDVNRERRYTPKPEDWQKRIEFHPIAYHCGY